MSDPVKSLLEAQLDHIKEVKANHMLHNSFRGLQQVCEAGLPFPNTILTFPQDVMCATIAFFIRVANSCTGLGLRPCPCDLALVEPKLFFKSWHCICYLETHKYQEH